MYDQNLRTRMATMSPQQLKQFAMMHKDDPFVVSMALDIDNTRKAAQRQQAMQAVAQPQPKVVDQDLAMIGQPAVPPQAMQAAPQAQAGLPQLPAQNIASMADGGIAGYDEGYAGGGTPKFDATPYLQNENVQRFLAYINTYEGAPQPNQTVGYHTFDDMSRHPNKPVKFNKKGDKSTAAGSYQLINKTWQAEAKRQGLEDFSLENQQRAAIGVLKDTGALDAIVRGDFETGKKKAAKAWASLPGSTIGEATGQHARVKPLAEQYLAAGKPTGPVLAEAGTREVPRTPEMLARQQAAIRRRQIAEALPIGSAQAAEMVSRDPSQPSFIDKLQRAAPPALGGRGELVSEVFGKKKTAAPPAEPKAGEFFPSNMLNPDIGRPRPALSAPATTPAAVSDGRFSAASVPGTPEAAAYDEQVRKARAKKEAERSLFDKLYGAAEAAHATVLGIPATATGAIAFDPIARFLEPKTEVGKEYAQNVHQALVEKGKLPPYIPGIGVPRAPKRAPAALETANLAEATAKAARERAETAKSDRLAYDPRVSETGTKPMTPLMEEIQAARAADAARQEFSIAPESADFGFQATKRRAQAKKAAEIAQAENLARAEEAKAAVAGDEVSAAELADRLIGERQGRDVTAESLLSVPGLAGQATEEKEIPPATTPHIPYSEEPGYDFSKKAGIETLPTKEPTTTPETTPEKKAGFGGLSDEDWVMMGLNMLQAPAGQTGNALSQLAQNVGRSGLATLGARKTREQQEIDKMYRQAHADYFKQMGLEAAAKADYYRDAKSEDARRLKVLDAVSESMKSWRQANFGATPQEEQAKLNELYTIYSKQIGLTPLAGASGSSNLFRVLPD